MENTVTYERIVPRASVGGFRILRLSLLAAYVLVPLIWVIPILRSMLNPYLIALAFFSEIILILCTKNYLHMEYEYAFVSGSLTVSKIYGKRLRRALVAPHDLLLIALTNEDTLRRASQLGVEKILYATATPDSSDTLLLVWEESKDHRLALIIESDTRTVAIFKRYFPSVCDSTLRFSR